MEYYINKKTKKVYTKLAVAIDTTNNRGDILTIVYCPVDNENTIFVKELNEFEDKFEHLNTVTENTKSIISHVWDGITDILTEEQIVKIEKLYSKELNELGIL